MCVGMGTGVCGISGVGTNAAAVAGEIEPGSVTHMHLHLICLMLSPTRGASEPERKRGPTVVFRHFQSHQAGLVFRRQICGMFRTPIKPSF